MCIENAVLHLSAPVPLSIWFRYVPSIDPWAGFDFMHVGGYRRRSSESGLGAGTEVTPVESAPQRRGSAVPIAATKTEIRAEARI